MSLTVPAGRATFRRLGRETATYGLGVILGRAVSFLMLPVYTRFLSPSDYGIIQLLDLTVDVAAIFFTAGASSGVQRLRTYGSSRISVSDRPRSCSRMT